jgi:hypothetical protein
MRHAEEPSDPKNPDLAMEGRLRADRLAIFVPVQFGEPDFVLSASPNKLSVRAFLTMRPLSLAIKERIDTSFKANKNLTLATHLFSDSIYVGKLVVICWTHSEIPALANALNARRRDYPDPWDETVFNLILQLDYRRRENPTTTKVVQPF